MAVASLVCILFAAQTARADECQGQPNYSACIDDGIPCTIDECRSESCIHRYDRVIYVRSRCDSPVETPNGCSWSNAFETIQDARAATDDYADTVEEIWVAVGVYKPVNVCNTNNCVSTGTCVPGSNTERSASFELKNTVHIYGGFRGTEVVRAERPTDPDPYTIDPLTDSVLTGDLNGDDPITTQADCESQALDGAWYNGKCIEDDNNVTTQQGCAQLGGIWVNGQRCIYDYSPVLTRRFENSSHVVRASGTDRNARLDGFTVTAGNDDGFANFSGGGGIRLDGNSRAKIWNCAILNNYAAGGGGGIYCPGDQGDPFASDIVQCVIARNVASHGGGIGGKGVSSHRIFNCQIVGNLSDPQGGGGLFLSEGSGDPIIVNTLIAGNTDTGEGGGIYVTGPQTTLTLKNCTLVNNYAPSGGAIRASGGVVVLVHNSIVWGNTADFGASIDAGGIFDGSRGRVEVRYSDVRRRRACAGGANNRKPCAGSTDCPGGGAYCLDLLVSGGPVGLCVGGTCGGGTCDGWSCGTAADCPGGTCNLCVGGTNNGNSCTTASQCPGGTCVVPTDVYDPGLYPNLRVDTDTVSAGNLLNVDPLFVDSDGSDNDPFTHHDNVYRLRPAFLAPGISPCLDAGSADLVPEDAVDVDQNGKTTGPETGEKTPLDLPGNPRFFDEPEVAHGGAPVNCAIVDMGAYEHRPFLEYWSDQPVSGSGTLNRYLAIHPGAAGAGPRAIAVTLVSVHHPNPPNIPMFPAPEFSSCEGKVRYVGAPQVFCEDTNTNGSCLNGTFLAARLQTTPHFQVWTGLGTVHVYGAEVVPSSIYRLQALDEAVYLNCGASYATTSGGTGNILGTERWGDIAATFNIHEAGAPVTQLNALDVTQLVNKMKGFPTPTLVQADLYGGVPDQRINALDLVMCVDAVKGFAYPFSTIPGCGQ